MKNRRQFLIESAAITIGSLMIRPSFAVGTSGHRLGTLGIQVSAVHADLNKDFNGTLARIAALGYREVELVWWFGTFDHTPKQLRQALDAAGLSAPSGHISAAGMLVGWERRLEQAHIMGHEYLFCTTFDA